MTPASMSGSTITATLERPDSRSRRTKLGTANCPPAAQIRTGDRFSGSNRSTNTRSPASSATPSTTMSQPSLHVQIRKRLLFVNGGETLHVSKPHRAPKVGAVNLLPTGVECFVRGARPSSARMSRMIFLNARPRSWNQRGAALSGGTPQWPKFSFICSLGVLAFERKRAAALNRQTCNPQVPARTQFRRRGHRAFATLTIAPVDLQTPLRIAAPASARSLQAPVSRAA